MFILSTQAGSLVKSVDSLHFINGEYVPSLSGKVKDNINPATEEVICTISQGGKEEGGEVLTGGVRPEGLEKGYYLEPTIITGLDRNCRVVKEEIFGPVVTVIPFDTEEDVLDQVNDTEYGLSASIWTNDIRRGHRMAKEIEAGIIWVNTWFLRDLRTPFGGMKQSGIGREGGIHSFEFYSELSNVCIKL